MREFVVLNRLENLFNSYIFEVAIANDLLIPVALGGKDQCLKIIKFKPSNTAVKNPKPQILPKEPHLSAQQKASLPNNTQLQSLQTPKVEFIKTLPQGNLTEKL